MKIKENIPNMLSVSRMFLAVAVLIFVLLDFRTVFLILYIAAGVTDFLDGFIARKYNYVTERGALLDSVADHIYFAVIVVSAFLCLNLTQSPVTIAVVATVAAVRVANFIITGFKFKRCGFIHTIGNKITAACLVIMVPICIVAGTMPVWLIIGFGVLATLTAIEETAILFKTHSYDVNQKSVFCA